LTAVLACLHLVHKHAVVPAVSHACGPHRGGLNDESSGIGSLLLLAASASISWVFAKARPARCPAARRMFFGLVLAQANALQMAVKPCYLE